MLSEEITWKFYLLCFRNAFQQCFPTMCATFDPMLGHVDMREATIWLQAVNPARSQSATMKLIKKPASEHSGNADPDLAYTQASV